MQICICDDDRAMHNEIKKLLTEYGAELTFKISDKYCGEELEDGMENCDIVFLDIEMSGISGVEAAERLREKYPDIIIIFVSSYREYISEAFRLEALHFIVKPIKKEDFKEVFIRALKKYNENHAFVISTWLNVRHKIPVKEITYIEGYHRDVTIHTACGKEYKSSGKLSDILKTVETNGFIQVHQGYIVNMAYIDCVDGNEIVLTGDIKIPISARKKSAAIKTFDSYIRKWRW